MNLITPVTSDSLIIQVVDLAKQIWNQHYLPIIGQEQVDYMLDKFQSLTAIDEQIKSGYQYYLLSAEERNIGYLALVPDAKQQKLMISKIYVTKESRGLGGGKSMLEFTLEQAKELGLSTVWLTVNKYNDDSINWYKKQGFEVTEEVVADIGNGYVMDDYILQLPVKVCKEN